MRSCKISRETALSYVWAPDWRLKKGRAGSVGSCKQADRYRAARVSKRFFAFFQHPGLGVVAAVVLACALVSCGAKAKETANVPQGREIGVVKATRKPLQRTLVVSSELIPFQQIDVYAKESGFVRQLNVDYGAHVKAGQVLAVLEIPELQMQVDEDEAEIKDATGQVSARTEGSEPRGGAAQSGALAIHAHGSGSEIAAGPGRSARR